MTENDSWRWIAAFMISVSLPSFTGCDGENLPVPKPQIVLFDTASKQPVVVPAATQYPVIHPSTGKPTLMPAMYCSPCNAWRPVPPPDQVNRVKQSLVCSKCRSPLTLEGPFPK